MSITLQIAQTKNIKKCDIHTNCAGSLFSHDKSVVSHCFFFEFRVDDRSDMLCFFETFFMVVFECICHSCYA